LFAGGEPRAKELITNGVFKGIGGVGKEHGHGIS